MKQSFKLFKSHNEIKQLRAQERIKAFLIKLKIKIINQLCYCNSLTRVNYGLIGFFKKSFVLHCLNRSTAGRPRNPLPALLFNWFIKGRSSFTLPLCSLLFLVYCLALAITVKLRYVFFFLFFFLSFSSSFCRRFFRFSDFILLKSLTSFLRSL